MIWRLITKSGVKSERLNYPLLTSRIKCSVGMPYEEKVVALIIPDGGKVEFEAEEND